MHAYLIADANETACLKKHTAKDKLEDDGEEIQPVQLLSWLWVCLK